MNDETKPRFDPRKAAVTNGGFTIDFDLDTTGPCLLITCPQGTFFRLWENNVDNDMPIIYGWESQQDEQEGTLNRWQLIVPRRGKIVSRTEVYDQLFLIVERIDQNGDVFYTVHQMHGTGEDVERDAEESEIEDFHRCDSLAHAIQVMGETMIFYTKGKTDETA